MARVLVSPLNWGLGHATRDIPIIREFLKNGHDVTLAASGRALEFLRQEFPQCRFIDFPDYKPPYTKSKWFVAYFALNLPFLLRAIASERRRAKKIIEDGRFDLVVSDNRFGVYHRNVPSYFISHQLMFNLPKYIKQAERLTKWFNSYHHLNFDGVIVPDFEGKNNLSGKLSHFHKRNPEVYYAGILTSVEKKKAKEDIDCLFMISGPEPQRTEFEKIVMSQIGRIKGKKVILLGTPEKKSKKVLFKNLKIMLLMKVFLILKLQRKI